MNIKNKKMKKIIIRNRFDDSVIYEHECENNTIKITVEKAVSEKVSLYSANLISADLRSANLISANLISANLISANLSSANNKELAWLPIFCKWEHAIIGDKIKIGCKDFTIEEWVNFFENSKEEFQTKRDTQDFKQIRAVFYSYKAYLENLK